MNQDLKWIKKHYSEAMMHLCRDYLPLILETPGLLPTLLKNNFHNHKTLAQDIINENQQMNFKNFMYSFIDINVSKAKSEKNPFELMKEAGYTLYKCDKVEDVEQFKKYYTERELLCTFDNIEGRLDRCHVFFAVKDNVDSIERAKRPSRDDEYSTSVLGIQFYKGEYNDVSIKSRYNHTVHNPDATLSNNLDFIKEGLTTSFENEYGYNITNGIHENSFILKEYVIGPNNIYYKENITVGTVTFCADNIFMDSDKVYGYDPEKCILIDNFLLDLVGKKLINFVDEEYCGDTFEKILGNIIDIKIEKQNNHKKITIKNDKDEENIIIINSSNEIVSVVLPYVKEIDDKFLYFNIKLRQLILPNVKIIGDQFLYSNEKMDDLQIPLVENIGDEFLYYNRSLRNIKLQNLKNVGDNFLSYAEKLNYINLPSLITIGDEFLYLNEELKYISLPSVEVVGCGFLNNNEILANIQLPNLQTVGNLFLYRNLELKDLKLPELRNAGSMFMYCNELLANIEVPKLEYISKSFLYYNEEINNIDLPNVKKISENFLYSNKNIDRENNKTI